MGSIPRPTASVDRKQAVLLIADKDFGELIFRRGNPHFGVVLVLLTGLTPAQKALIVADHVANRVVEFEMAFSVITRRTV